jgi:hypothetical protein
VSQFNPVVENELYDVAPAPSEIAPLYGSGKIEPTYAVSPSPRPPENYAIVLQSAGRSPTNYADFPPLSPTELFQSARGD